jgi:hypothetical protein
MNCYFRDINCGSINNYLIDVYYFQGCCKYEKCVADKTAARSSMGEKTKPSRFSVVLKGLTKMVSFASKLKNLIDFVQVDPGNPDVIADSGFSLTKL